MNPIEIGIQSMVKSKNGSPCLSLSLPVSPWLSLIISF